MEFTQQLVWEKIILDWLTENIDHISYSGSLNSWQLANKAREAWNMLQLWQVPLSQIKKYCTHQELKAFLAWADNYKLISSTLNLTSAVPKTNFYNQNTADLNVNCQIAKIAGQDFLQEINLAAAWAAESQLDNIGIVVLNLDTKYSQIDYIFSNFFSASEYNIAVPVKLKNFVLIDIALLILQIANCYITQENIKYEDFSKLLRTKFILGGNLELGERSYADYILREIVDYKFDLQYIKNYLLKILPKNNLLNNLLNDFTIKIDNKNSINNLTKKYTCQYWMEFIQEILAIFAWGKENIDIQEQHIVDSWQDLLKQYIELENFLGEHNFSKCIEILIKLSNSYNITKNNLSKNIKNINILSLPEAIAISAKFDGLWVCGLSEIDWLPEEQFNPFLPIVLQKEFAISEKKHQQLQQLINLAKKQFVCSYPLYIDNNLVRPSPLIKDFPEFVNNLSLNVAQQNQFIIENYLDDTAPTYQKNLFSGTNFLKLQATCPFKAQATIRLQAAALDKPIAYLSKALKGDVLHKTLAQFWLKYKNSTALQQLSTDFITKKLFIISRNILYKLKKNKPTTLNTVIIQLEALKIANLCSDFIKKYDLSGAEFSVIHIEEKFVVKLQEFLINIKLDRVDQLANGDLLVIDYKTGKISNDDPQLPIYSLSLPNIKKLMLAIIRPDKLELSEFELSKIDLENLYQLATEFKNGVAIVKPKHGSMTCRICDLKYTCRIFAKNSLINHNNTYEQI